MSDNGTDAPSTKVPVRLDDFTIDAIIRGFAEVLDAAEVEAPIRRLLTAAEVAASWGVERSWSTNMLVNSARSGSVAARRRVCASIRRSWSSISTGPQRPRPHHRPRPGIGRLPQMPASVVRADPGDHIGPCAAARCFPSVAAGTVCASGVLTNATATTARKPTANEYAVTAAMSTVVTRLGPTSPRLV
jgi:hypothetical protein